MRRTSPLKRRPFALYGAIAVVVLAILGWLFMRPHSETAPATCSASRYATGGSSARSGGESTDSKPTAAKPSATKARETIAIDPGNGGFWPGRPFRLASRRLHLQGANQG